MSTNIQRIRRSAQSSDNATRTAPPQSNGSTARRPINTATISTCPSPLRRGRGRPTTYSHRKTGRKEIPADRIDQCAQGEIGPCSVAQVAITVRPISKFAGHRTSVGDPSRKRPPIVTLPCSDSEWRPAATRSGAVRPFV